MIDVKNELFKWFEELGFKTRDEVRIYLDVCPVSGLNQSIVEGYFSEYKKNKKENTPTKTIKVVSISDLHIPYQNQKMVDAFIKLCGDEQPDKIILNGDIVDFYELSSFDKNPQRIFDLQDELDTCKDFLFNLRHACPDSEIIYIIGNHEDRLRRYLWKNATALSSLKALKFEELLGLSLLNVKLEEVSHTVNGFKYKHGDVVRSHGSYSAKAEFERELASGESGHTHRVGSYCKTTEAGAYGWFESGCACGLNPEYINGTPNWQNSFTVRYFDDNAYDTHQVFVNKGKFRFNGKVY